MYKIIRKYMTFLHTKKIYICIHTKKGFHKGSLDYFKT